ncbi:MAG: cold shock and DUF1294 domain-containing protein [Trichocoleus desertorum ATA4-8-CV12]|jgi:uncharacterized repeat protein (TIGR01451 family)|nr:cold shock and DUF1294 domain-containing protein [Trichocoleus desertorum ATA4-8-CV12]
MKPVLRKGQLVTWKDDRGFGFIKPSDSNEQVFFHITALKDANRRPQVGDVIYYQLSVEQNGKARASNASIQGVVPKQSLHSPSFVTKAGARPQPRAWSAQSTVATLLLALLPSVGAVHFALTTANVIPFILYPVMSLITFCLYATDKSRAQQKQWRVPENTLHFCELLGGWLGGFVAQQKFRHKTRKTSYQIVFWLIAALHITFWLYWFFFRETLIPLLSP